VKPVYIGDTIRVRLTCKQKTVKEDREGQIPQGVVAWDVEISNQDGEAVAIYTILTLVKRLAESSLASSPSAVAAAVASEAPAERRPVEQMEKTQPGDAPARVS